MLRTRIAPLLALMLISTACIQTVRVTAYAEPGAKSRKTFRLIGPDPTRLGGDPLWPRYAGQLIRALEDVGFVHHPTSPEVVIRVSYRRGDTEVYERQAEAVVDGRAPTVASSGTVVKSRFVLQVEAMDLASWTVGQPLVLWRTHAAAIAEDAPMEEVLPSLVAAASIYFATSLSSTANVHVEREQARRLTLGIGGK